METIPVFLQRLVERCHITLPDSPEPIGAIHYEGEYFVYLKFFPSQDAAQRAAQRMVEKGNRVILTRVPKGLVLWVYEPEARLAKKSAVH